MLVLKSPAATPEQLRVISGTKLGVEIIRGAAGSGKTSTALLRLSSLAHLFAARFQRTSTTRPIRILVLTFNRTLAGYVEHLAVSQMSGWSGLNYEISTFGSWATSHLSLPPILEHHEVEYIYSKLLSGLNFDLKFLLNEIDYICGRFPSGSRDLYLTAERTGRGSVPQVPRSIRPLILAAIDRFYTAVQARNACDWHMVTEAMANREPLEYDVVIVDEAQDFSANQFRAILHHLASPHCLTLVMDTVQRLYPRGFTWSEVGVDARAAVYHRLTQNHRNTVEIAEFASAVVAGMSLDDDGTMPDFASASRRGPKPVVAEGLYGEQVAFAVEYIRRSVDLSSETVAFLSPVGGKYFDYLRAALVRSGLGYVEITRGREWPTGPQNVALSTMHSAKGLEFDHVFILGLNAEVTPISDDSEEESTLHHRRLLAMAVGRARRSVVIGYKPAEASKLVRYFKQGTFERVVL